MGYVTHYSLTVDTADKATVSKIGKRKVDRGDVRLRDLEGQDEQRWYEHEADMLAVSAEFPGVTFRLCGVGEETLDHWVKWFRDGALIATISAVMPPDPITFDVTTDIANA